MQAELYNYMYSHSIPNHGLYGLYGRRDQPFVTYIRENVPPSASIFDASCGRGTLLRWLIAEGYDASGSEIADFLLNPGGDLYGMPVELMSYEELWKKPDNLYDVVVSNDVIEHLKDEDVVNDALSELSRISKKWLLISTGGTRDAWFPFSHVFKDGKLHNVIKEESWWKETVGKYMDIDKEDRVSHSLFYFGTIK